MKDCGSAGRRLFQMPVLREDANPERISQSMTPLCYNEGNGDLNVRQLGVHVLAFLCSFG